MNTAANIYLPKFEQDYLSNQDYFAVYKIVHR